MGFNDTWLDLAPKRVGDRLTYGPRGNAIVDTAIQELRSRRAHAVDREMEELAQEGSG
jgi:hypothetical protein